MAINPSEYTPLFTNGKRDKARRYENRQGDIISRRQYEKASGLLSHRPSSQPKGKQVPSIPPTPRGKAVKGVKIEKPPSRYSADIANYAKKYGLTKQQARGDFTFKLLNRQFSQKLKQRDKLINEIALGQRKKQDVSGLIAQKNDLENQLGEIARQLGRKKPSDFTPFGQTP
jgi:hypothetical protein